MTRSLFMTLVAMTIVAAFLLSLPSLASAAAKDDVKIETKDLTSHTAYFVRNSGSKTVIATVRTTWQVAGQRQEEKTEEYTLLAGEQKQTGDRIPRHVEYKVEITGARYK
jgi:hypothetical protein